MSIIKTTPASTALRACALVGLGIWILAGVYVVLFLFTGFVDFTAPNIYVTAAVVLGGFFVNALLLTRAKISITRATFGLALISALMSAVVLATFVDVAFDLGS